jgi:hypothetical protein
MPNRRTNVYPAQFVDEVRWLVIDDPCGDTIQSVRLEPNADLVAALQGVREHYIADGWKVGEFDKWQAVYATKGTERLSFTFGRLSPETPSWDMARSCAAIHPRSDSCWVTRVQSQVFCLT